MKWLICLSQIVLFSVCLALPSVTSAAESYSSNSFINRIDGIVWDPYRHPVSDVYVELQNENYSTISRIRTDATGRFSFIGIVAGHYNIRVLTTGANYLEYTEGIDVVNVVQRASDQIYLDIYLRFDKRKFNPGVTDMTGAIFVQEVPDAARKLYKKGVRDISEKGEKG